MHQWIHQRLRKQRSTLGLLLVTALVASVGCESSRGPQWSQRDADTNRGTGGADTVSVVAYPSGQRDTSVLLVEKTAPKQVRLGQPFKYTVTVTNLTDQPLENVRVYESLPQTMTVRREMAVGSGALASADRPRDQFIVYGGGPGSPQPQQAAPGIFATPRTDEEGAQAAGLTGEWRIGRLGPNETRTIELIGTARDLGDIRAYTAVSYMPTLLVTTQVVEPQIKIARQAPERVLVCEPVVIEYHVTNTGTGTSRNIRVTERLPEGQTLTTGGGSLVDFRIESLGPGETKSHTVSTQVEAPGRYWGRATAVEQTGLTIESLESMTIAAEPQLEIELSAPANAFINRPLNYDIRVTNIGDAAARDLTVTHILPQGAKVTAMGLEGKASGNQVTWTLQPLEPGMSHRFRVTAEMAEPASASSQLTAKAYCVDQVQASVTSNVTGIAAMLLEVRDNNDPVPLGGNESYDITVTNQGTEPNENVALTITLPPNMRYVNSSGAGVARVRGDTVSIQIGRIDAGMAARVALITQAVAAGDVRLKVQMTSDSLETPVLEEESTRLY